LGNVAVLAAMVQTRNVMRIWSCIMALVVILSKPVSAADLISLPQTDAFLLPPPTQSIPFISEIRGGAFAHGLGSPERDGRVDLNAELLFVKPFHTSDWTDILIPMPHLGTTVNFVGDTSTIYAGLTWRYDISTTAFFVEATSGGSLNNGQLQDFHNDRNALGCHVLFRESGSLGYHIDTNWNVMATIEHSSNANLCHENRGLTNVGLRVGYQF
jgi:lipid A 3-O-deacylase